MVHVAAAWPTPSEGQSPREWLAERYPELRRMAAKRLRGRAIHREIGTTSLVNEATVRIITAERRQKFKDISHFFATAAYAMRSALVDHCRRRLAAKRAGRETPLLHDPAAPDEDERLLALDEALDELAKEDALAAELVKLRFFAGLSAERAARCVGVSDRQGGRLWAFARAWLACRIGDGEAIS
jgi:RNA polymerase sigma factor (TIGR02999 family)